MQVLHRLALKCLDGTKDLPAPASFHLCEQLVSSSLQTQSSRKVLRWRPTEVFWAVTQHLLEAQDSGWARGCIYLQVMLFPNGELSKPADSLVQVLLSWHISVNRCEQVYGGIKCQCFIAGTESGLHAQETTTAVLCSLPIKTHCCLAPIYHSTCE